MDFHILFRIVEDECGVNKVSAVFFCRVVGVKEPSLTQYELRISFFKTT